MQCSSRSKTDTKITFKDGVASPIATSGFSQQYKKTIESIEHPSIKMSGEKRKHQNITIHTKAKILCRHLYENAKIGDLDWEYNLADSTISTWKKNKEKIFQEAAEVGQDWKRKGQSPYLQVELAMLYWVRQMWSRVQPPPLTYHILKMKAK